MWRRHILACIAEITAKCVLQLTNYAVAVNMPIDCGSHMVCSAAIFGLNHGGHAINTEATHQSLHLGEISIIRRCISNIHHSTGHEMSSSKAMRSVKRKRFLHMSPERWAGAEKKIYTRIFIETYGGKLMGRRDNRTKWHRIYHVDKWWSPLLLLWFLKVSFMPFSFSSRERDQNHARIHAITSRRIEQRLICIVITFWLGMVFLSSFRRFYMAVLAVRAHCPLMCACFWRNSTQFSF